MRFNDWWASKNATVGFVSTEVLAKEAWDFREDEIKRMRGEILLLSTQIHDLERIRETLIKSIDILHRHNLEKR